MKFFYIIILTLFFVSGYSQQNMDTIYGNPKSVREDIQLVNRKMLKKSIENYGNIFRNTSIYRSKSLSNFLRNMHESHINCSREFNTDGLKIYEEWFDISGVTERRFYFKYDNNKNLIEEKEVYFNDEYSVRKLHYNKKGKLIASSYYNSSEPNEFVHRYYIRNVNGIVIKTISIDEDGEPNSIENVLGQNGNVVRIIKNYTPNWINEDNTEIHTTKSISILKEFDYDKNGNKTHQLNYNTSEDRVYSKYAFKYDNENRLVEEIVYPYPNDSSKHNRTLFEYNKSGFIVYQRQLRSMDSLRNKSIQIFYNSDNFIVKSIVDEVYNINYKYKFDKKGNWTAITKIVNDEPLYVWTRKIKYYKD